MNTTDNRRIRARSRADRRLHAMTIGTAVLGVVATGAFGYAAALTYTGTTSSALADSQGQQAAGDPNAGVTDPNAGVTNPNTGVTNPNTGATNPNTATTPQAGTVPTVRHSRKSSGHAATGGS